MAERLSLDTQVGKIVRLFDRDIIYASEAAHMLIFAIEYDIAAFGADGQIEWLINHVPDLPKPIQLEMKAYVQTPDDRIFVRNVHVSGPYPPPENWTPDPVAVQSNVDYSGAIPKITVLRDDGTTYEVDASDPWPLLIFALRRHFRSMPNVAK